MQQNKCVSALIRWTSDHSKTTLTSQALRAPVHSTSHSQVSDESPGLEVNPSFDTFADCLTKANHSEHQTVWRAERRDDRLNIRVSPKSRIGVTRRVEASPLSVRFYCGVSSDKKSIFFVYYSNCGQMSADGVHSCAQLSIIALHLLRDWALTVLWLCSGCASCLAMTPAMTLAMGSARVVCGSACFAQMCHIFIGH